MHVAVLNELKPGQRDQSKVGVTRSKKRKRYLNREQRSRWWRGEER